MDLAFFTALVLTCLVITDMRSAGWGAEGQGTVSPLLPAYLGVVVRLHGGVHGARVGRELHDGHAGVVDGGVGKPRAIRRPPVSDVGLQNLL